MTEASRQRRINQTVNRAREQGLDVSAKFLVECLFDLSDNEDSEDSSDGDCCLKDLATTLAQNQTKQMEMANDDKERIHNKKREKICRKKGGQINQNKPSGHKYFPQKIRKGKEEQSMCPKQRRKKERRKKGSTYEV